MSAVATRPQLRPTNVVIGCPMCHPELASSAERTGPNHWSVAWSPLAECFLGEEKLMDVTECVTGRDGWALRIVFNEIGNVPVCCQPNFARFRHESPFWMVREITP